MRPDSQYSLYLIEGHYEIKNYVRGREAKV
jgi:hypothetical protein